MIDGFTLAGPWTGIMAGQSGSLRTIERATEILELLQEEGGLGVSDLAARMDVPKSTVHDYLRTLEELGFIDNDGGTYSLGLRLLQFGGHVKHRNRLFHVARPQLERLSDLSGEMASVNIEDQGRFVILHTEVGPESLRLGIYPGMTTPIHTHAAGKSILAALPDERVDEILDRRGLEQVTAETITDRATLDEEIAEIAERGYGVDTDQQVVGMGVIAAPVTTERRVLGSIGLVCPTDRLEEEAYRSELAAEVQKAANVVGVNYQYSP